MEGLAIEAGGLTKRYGKRTVVDALSLAVRPGTVVGLLGPNGSGKTTTIRMLLGLVRPTSGEARIFGHDVVRARREVAPLVGAIVDSPALLPYLSARDTLRLIAHTAELELAPSRSDELLELVGLLPRADSLVRTYSLGMRQRLGIAAALVGRPRLLFLDEPMNGLDPEGTIEVRELVARLGREGYTVLVTSHLLDEVERVAGDVVFIRDGRVVASGAVGDLVAGSSAFRFVATPVDRALGVLTEIPNLRARRADESAIEVRCDRSGVPYAVFRLAGAGVDVYEVTPISRRLEDIYLEVASAGVGSSAGARAPKEIGS